MSFVLIVSLDLYLLSLDSFCLINCHEIEYLIIHVEILSLNKLQPTRNVFACC